jgi:hypothetical protein
MLETIIGVSGVVIIIFTIVYKTVVTILNK